MNQIALILVLALSVVSCGNVKLLKRSEVPAEKSAPSTEVANTSKIDKDYLQDFCQRELLDLPGPYDKKLLSESCRKVEVIEGCESVNGDPIFHYDKAGESDKSKRVIAISLIHGDEIPAGSVARNWMARLESISPRNHWRVIPLANPDGVKLRTRMNANKVDINRNFPSKDWDELALKYWKTKKRSDPRRYPGPSSASEVETRCLMKHLTEFKPDFIISVHTPLGVLDFDGPKVANPHFRPLPWVSLGNFPGSLGRYMWVDRKVPVLTIELKGSSGLRSLEEFDKLQDITGTIAIQSDRLLKKDH